MANLIEEIKQTMSTKGIDYCNVIVNGLYWVYHGNTVNVRLDSDDEGVKIGFFTGSLREPEYLDNVEMKLSRQLRMNVDLTGIEFLQGLTGVHCEIVEGEGILLLKSALYDLMEKSMELMDTQSLKVEGHGPLTEAELTRLRNLAMKWQYYAFGETMYKRYKPITSFARYNQFYKLFRLYVPVIIKTTFMANPLLNEPRFVQSDLYNLALEKNRKVVTPDSMECYFLTELEVCKALHLRNFTRLTPALYYRVVVGALRADIPNFPRVARSDIDIRYVRPRGMYQDPFRNEYDLQQYATLLQQYQGSVAELESLREFRKVDSLFTECAKEARILKKYGGYVLDTADAPINASSLYKILREVRV